MSDVSIEVRENGPLKVVGPITVLDSEGREFQLPAGSAVALCRCGQSQNKPFCDASHRRLEWTATETAPRSDL
jgi:CDGSH iron-sulfur domain-containing protein 3